MPMATGWELGCAWLPLPHQHRGLLKLLRAPSSPGGSPVESPSLEVFRAVWIWHLGTWVSGEHR